MSRILIPGWTAPHSFETACARAFRRQGHEVSQFENKPPRWWLGGRTWWKLSAPERFASDLVSSAGFYREAKRSRPDAIFLTKAENLRAEAFSLLRKAAPFQMAVWYVDNPFHASVSSYQSLRHIQKADVYFVWSNYLVDPLISAGAKRVEFLPFAFDPESHPDIGMTDEELGAWASDLCFVGTWDAEREAALLPLAGQGIDLAIYGQGWTTSLARESPLRAHVRRDSIWGEDLVRAFRGAKLVLNLLRQHNWKGHNFRTMEAAGIGGGALLTPWTRDQAETLFLEGEEVLCFRGASPDAAAVREFLADPAKLKKISSAARQRVYREHLLAHRLGRVSEVLGLSAAAPGPEGDRLSQNRFVGGR